MVRIVWVIALAAVLWVATFVTLTLIRLKLIAAPGNVDDPQMALLMDAQMQLLNGGGNVIGYLGPVVQFGLIVAILIYAAQKLNLLSPSVSHPWKADSLNVQAVIAIIVVGTFSLAALTNLGSTHFTDVKDIVLVVVGFYFGTRRREGDATADAATAKAANAGAMEGASAATGATPPPLGSAVSPVPTP